MDPVTTVAACVLLAIATTIAACVTLMIYVAAEHIRDRNEQQRRAEQLINGGSIVR